MKLFIFIFLLTASAFAEVLEVHSLASHQIREKTWIVKFLDGRVGFWNEDEDPKIRPVDLEHAILDAELSSNSELTGVRILGRVNPFVQDTEAEKGWAELNYVPTVYSSYSFATDVLRSMRRTWREDSQCYDRSHIWAYEELAYGRRYLQKVFLFFSDAYIARYNFPWWFHTAPYALVRLNGETVERIMDPGFVDYPYRFKLWTDLFMKNKAECKVVQKYSDYSTHPGEDDCYLIKSSLYFWQPRDLEAFERSGVEKKKFIDWEVRHAYRYGFGL